MKVSAYSEIEWKVRKSTGKCAKEGEKGGREKGEGGEKKGG